MRIYSGLFAALTTALVSLPGLAATLPTDATEEERPLGILFLPNGQDAPPSQKSASVIELDFEKRLQDFFRT